MIPDLRCGRGIPLLQPHEYPQAQAFSQARHLFDKPVQLNRTCWIQLNCEACRLTLGKAQGAGEALRKHGLPERHKPVFDVG